MGRGGAGFVRVMPRLLGSPSARSTTSELAWRPPLWSMPRVFARASILALVLLLPSLAVACGGGGGGGGSPTEPSPTPTPSVTPTPTPTPPPGTGITFTAASAGPGIVLAQGAGTSSSSLTVDVRAAQVSGLYGIAFDLDYPSAVLHYQSATAGTFLGSSGQISMQVVESAPGHLVVGVTRLGDVRGVDGSGIVASLVFTPVANGSGPFTFSRNTAFQSEGTTVTLQWAGGTVTVAR